MGSARMSDNFDFEYKNFVLLSTLHSSHLLQVVDLASCVDLHVVPIAVGYM